MRMAPVTMVVVACTSAVWVVIVSGGEAAQPGRHPEALREPSHPVPKYLSETGRLVMKDCVMLGAAVLTMADVAKTYLTRRALSETSLGE
jgi:uncharacterized membrane protein YkgB